MNSINNEIVNSLLHTHEIQGRRCLYKEYSKGDGIVVTDPEGDQACLILTFDRDFHCLNASLQTDITPDKCLIKISDINPSAQATLKKLGFAHSEFEVLNLFPRYSPAESSRKIVFKKDSRCLIIAHGGDMNVENSNPPTKIAVKIEYLNNPSKPELPEPLGKCLQDFRIEHSTAQAYKVKAGQYIQIIDVEGNQCTDFQASREEDLKNRFEYFIDSTTTRSMTASAYPAPGLLSKFYNNNFDPMLELVQDTVCRHDTFGLACNKKYYEDQGYPGHINCTDNFNSALSPYGVFPRKGWEAINFFFNTNIDNLNQISLDEPWSRPGDYVILRALTDLVCVSSACPDDIDGANGWNPTDIHVRVYDKDLEIFKAIAHRITPDSTPTMTKETGFYQQLSKLTRNFTDYKGYWIANDFINYGSNSEYWACRKKVAVMDLSALRKFEVYGPDAESLMQFTLPRDIKKLSIGQVVYTAICYENGCMMDDGTLFKLGENNFRWICGNDRTGIWMREIAKRENMKVWVKSATDQLHNLAVQGPESRDLLKKIIWTCPSQPKVEELKWFRFAIARINNEKGLPLIVSRTGYTGELGYELFCHPKDCTELWDHVWEAGMAHSITPMGLNALDMLRIEAGLIFADYEFCDQTDPFEAGIGFSVPLKSKTDPFIGRESLLRRKENPQRKLAGLEIQSNEQIFHGDPVFFGRQQVGVITSSTRSPLLSKNIALARIDIEYTEIGNNVEIGKLDGHKKRIPAQLTPFPFYDPQKERVRM